MCVNRSSEKPLRPGEKNPLPFCSYSGLPDFPAIQIDRVLPLLESLVARYRSGVEQRLAQDSAPDWSFIEAEMEWADAIEQAWSTISHLNAVADEPRLREVYNQGLDLLTTHQTWRSQHRGIYQVYQGLHRSAAFQVLSAQQQRIVTLELRDFHLAGVDLDDAAREDYRDIVLRLSKLGAQFQENVLDATNAWSQHFEDAQVLAGLPAAEMRLLAENARARAKGGWLVDLSYPSYAAIVTYAHDRALRQQVYTAYVTRASDQGPNAGEWDNTPVIQEILALRHRLASLLGYPNYVDYALATRMAESPESVQRFLHDLLGQALPAAAGQLEMLTGFAVSRGAHAPLQPWDMGFWAERYRQAELGLSDELLKPYFSQQGMIAALFHIIGRVFGISLERDERVPVWHESVHFYWLHDTDGQRCAGMYVDLFARQNKRSGAWMDVVRSRRRLALEVQLPAAYLNCNFPPPSEGHPSLLTHDDVQTLFHEFGHCLHHMLTEIDWPQINGIHNVEWDAVELPSQLLENWCWEEHLLDGFARHYETGEPLPDDLKQRLLRSRHFHKAMMMVRQLEFALGDLRLHLEYAPDAPRDPLEIVREVRQHCSVVATPEWNRFLNSFSHIFGGGYAAGYYSYLWAEQLAADAWERFVDEGPFNPETGLSLRREIYATGAARPFLESFTAFRGRPPEAQALLRSYGLEQ